MTQPHPDQITPGDGDGLLPCPFCGSKPVTERTGFSGRAMYVYCINDNGCPRPKAIGESEEKAIENWNTRATRDAAEGARLPCDVHLPPNTFIRKGCQVETLLGAIQRREKYPDADREFDPASYFAAPPKPAEDKPVDPSIYFRDMRMLKAFIAYCERVGLPSGAGAAEPVRDLLFQLRDYLDLNSKPENDLARKYSKQISAILATPPVRGDREELEAVADAIDAARYNHPDHPRPRLRSFAEADRSDREYAIRLAKAAILSLPVQPGAGEREAELLRSAERMRDMLTADGDPPSLLIPADIIDGDEANEFTQAFDELAKAIRAYRQAPHSSREGGG